MPSEKSSYMRQLTMRIIVALPGLLVLGLMALLIKQEYVNNNQYIILFTNGIIPSAFLAWYLSSGVYDFLVWKALN